MQRQNNLLSYNLPLIVMPLMVNESGSNVAFRKVSIENWPIYNGTICYGALKEA